MNESRGKRKTGNRGTSRSPIQLYIAEYEALMTRNSYIMTLQYSIFPVVVLILTLFAPMWSFDPGKWDHNKLLIWVAYTALVIASIVWTDTLWEIYNNVWYLERKLKPLVTQVCGANVFWGYEGYLASVRGRKPQLWELTQPALAGVLFVVAVYLTSPFNSVWPFRWWEYIAVVFTALLNWRLWWRSIAAIRLRQGFADIAIAGESPESGKPRQAQGWAVAAITLGTGIIPLLLITHFSDTLGLNSGVSSPLAAVPSVLIGDSLILPIANWRIVQLLTACLAISTARPLMLRLAIAAFVASFISAYSNYRWTHDQYFGFIDPAFGKLSFAGWWHLGFTIVEMTLVLAFVLMWDYAIRRRARKEVQRLAVSAWNAFLPYTLLSLADFLVLHLYLLPRRGISDYTPFTAWEALLVVPFWIAVRIYFRWLRQRYSSGSTSCLL